MPDFLNSFKISSTALYANRLKMNVIAQNLANAETTRTPEGGPYRRQMVVLKNNDVEDIPDGLEKYQKRKAGLEEGEFFTPFESVFNKEQGRYTGVEVSRVVKSQEDFSLIYNPSHPDADPVSGYVAMPNVDTLTEVADMVVAKRAYEANVTSMKNTKEMIMKALEIGRQ
ncbi:MAG: flagellar basal body rod protein FlgC [Deltaproteobacteria bacterium]|nr:MAG: flagellar basal body rod protein FlgC [Deltaproteobacteria bacterium]